MSHPLFETDKVITQIRVVRFETTGAVSVPRSFPPEELPDLATLAQMFGGGAYELIARGLSEDPKTKKQKETIVDRRKYFLPGPSKALAPEAAPPPAAVAPPSSDPFMAMIQMMATQQQQTMQMMAAQQHQNMQMMVQTMTAAQQSQTALVTALLQNRGNEGATASTALADLARAALERRGAEPGLSPKDLLELGHRIGAAEADDGEDDGDDDGGIGALLGGFAQAKAALDGRNRGGNGPDSPN